MSQLEMMGVLLGGLLSAVFVGYMVLAEYGSKAKHGYSRPQRFAGGFTVLSGGAMCVAWIYFMLTGWESFSRNASLAAHVVFELVASVALVVAGAAMLRGLRRAPALVLTSYGLFVFTQAFSLAAFGPVGHPFLMSGAAIILLVVLVYFVGVVYAWEHFVLHLDEPESEERKRDAA